MAYLKILPMCLVRTRFPSSFPVSISSPLPSSFRLVGARDLLRSLLTLPCDLVFLYRGFWGRIDNEEYKRSIFLNTLQIKKIN